jgi:hypothetical protein
LRYWGHRFIALRMDREARAARAGAIAETQTMKKSPADLGMIRHRRGRALIAPMPIADPSDAKIDRGLRQQPPKVALAPRYSMRGRFRNVISRHLQRSR